MRKAGGTATSVYSRKGKLFAMFKVSNRKAASETNRSTLLKDFMCYADL